MNQKGAAPITDIRAKRQAATLNVEDLPQSNQNAQMMTQNVNIANSLMTHGS